MKATLLSIAYLCSGVVSYPSQPTLVYTSSGPVRGHAAPRAPTVKAYLGIPYAEAPIGDLRFAAPQPFRSNFHGRRVFGDDPGFSCPIPPTYSSDLLPNPKAGLNLTAAGIAYLNGLAQVNEKFGEDCLVLNVWSKFAAADKPRAVMLWLPGGGYVGGSSNGNAYDGAKLADEQDIVVVTINYRLNILGFPGAPGTQNVGLLDQRLAVEWTRSNIAFFGGDPKRITLAGESAGAGSVDYYSYAWASDPIVRSLIAQSGTVHLVEPRTSQAASDTWTSTAAAFGCSTTSQNAALKCMRALPLSTLLGSSQNLTLYTPFTDDSVVYSLSKYANLASTGAFARLPLLIGHNANEGTLFDLIQRLNGIVMPPAFWQAFETIGFFCPAAARSAISARFNAPTWRYRYSASWPDEALSRTFDAGAYHGVDVGVLFDSVASGPGIPPSSSEELVFRAYVRGAWGAFIKDPKKGLAEYGWPDYRKAAKVVVLGEKGKKVEFVDAAKFDAVCNA